MAEGRGLMSLVGQSPQIGLGTLEPVYGGTYPRDTFTELQSRRIYQPGFSGR